MTTDPAIHHFSKDGSSTLYSNQFGQYYHNPNGAVSESKHVFFEIPKVPSALIDDRKSFTFFEIGFGTGLNFLLLLDLLLSNEVRTEVHFYSVEAFPVSLEIANSFNFGDFLTRPELQQIIPDIFSNLNPGTNHFIPIPNKKIHLHLFQGYFDELKHPDNKADFIFHDAFSPEVNAELWSVKSFEKLISISAPDVVLSTYCAASKARASMAKAGWKIARAKGALGKREMTLASLNENKLSGYKRINESRLIERFDSGDFDG